MKKAFFIFILCGSVITNLLAQNNTIASTGPVGIGTTTPISGSYLHVYRNASGNYNPLAMFQDALPGGFTQIGIKATGRTFHIGVGNSGSSFGLNDKFFIWDQNAILPRFVIDANGSVGIGTTAIDNSYKLFVEGGIRSRKLRVDQATWPDYVFDTAYNLPDLSCIKSFIEMNGHLPNVPTALEVERDGIDVGENQAALLRKIEELTLYIIDQDKRLKELERRVKDFESNKFELHGAK